jgi:hypothetical protein
VAGDRDTWREIVNWIYVAGDRDTWREIVNWIYVAGDRETWREIVNTGMNFWGLHNTRGIT